MTRVTHIQPNEATGGKPPETCCVLHSQLLLKSKIGVPCSVFSHTHHSDPEPNWYIYHSDHLGSSAFLTDASGDPTQHLQYMPFGETFVEQRSTTSYYTPYTFSAKERDTETGYSYFGARYYDADISVWLSVDPMAYKYPSMSAYMYCAGRPVVLVDPGGDSTIYFNSKGVKLFVSHDLLPNSIVIIRPINESMFTAITNIMKQKNRVNNNIYNNFLRTLGLKFDIDGIKKWYNDLQKGEWGKSSTGADIRLEKKSWTTINDKDEISIDSECELGWEGGSTPPKKIPKNKYGSIHSHYLDQATKIGVGYDDYMHKVRAKNTSWDIMVEGFGGKPGSGSKINAIYFFTNNPKNTIVIKSGSFTDQSVNDK